MDRNKIFSDTIALLATGDEIQDGDILNTNSQEIAHLLFSQGMEMGTHMVVGDHIMAIENAVRYLLQSHRALIITGGLGPTSDDLTRYALSNAINRPLVFDEATWQTIVQRLAHLGYHTPPITNRQQALFPEGATIVPNPHGTAAGCFIQQEEQAIFMLPGPPIECLPMAHQMVLPTLQQLGLQKIKFHEKWLLFGVSEGQIAEELDEIVKPFDCMTGYRLFYPYIEFKLYSSHSTDFHALLPTIHQAIAPYILEDGKKTASELLLETLVNCPNVSIIIQDQATGGLLESILFTPKTCQQIHFTPTINHAPTKLKVIISGLEAFWQQQPAVTHTTLTLQFQQDTPLVYQVPYRGLRVKQYAAELVCRKLYQYLNKV